MATAPDQDVETVRKTLEKRGALSKACPCCDRTDWHVHDHVLVLRRDAPSGGSWLPSAGVFCGNCGFARFHVLHKLGLKGGDSKLIDAT